MELPGHLVSQVTLMRTMIARMVRENAYISLNNVYTGIASIRELTEPNAQFEKSVLSIVSAASDLRSFLESGNTETEVLRKNALDATDQMTRSLGKCRPSKKAINLGLDW